MGRGGALDPRRGNRMPWSLPVALKHICWGSIWQHISTCRSGILESSLFSRSRVLCESIASQSQSPPAKISSGKLRLALLPNMKKKPGRRDLDYSAGSAASNAVTTGLQPTRDWWSQATCWRKDLLKLMQMVCRENPSTCCCMHVVCLCGPAVAVWHLQAAQLAGDSTIGRALKIQDRSWWPYPLDALEFQHGRASPSCFSRDVKASIFILPKVCLSDEKVLQSAPWLHRSIPWVGLVKRRSSHTVPRCSASLRTCGRDVPHRKLVCRCNSMAAGRSAPGDSCASMDHSNFTSMTVVLQGCLYKSGRRRTVPNSPSSRWANKRIQPCAAKTCKDEKVCSAQARKTRGWHGRQETKCSMSVLKILLDLSSWGQPLTARSHVERQPFSGLAFVVRCRWKWTNVVVKWL